MIDKVQREKIAKLRAGQEVWLNFDGHRIHVVPSIHENALVLALVPFLTRANLGLILESSSKNGMILYTYNIYDSEPTNYDWIRDNRKIKRLGAVVEIHPNENNLLADLTDQNY